MGMPIDLRHYFGANNDSREYAARQYRHRKGEDAFLSTSGGAVTGATSVAASTAAPANPH